MRDGLSTFLPLAPGLASLPVSDGEGRFYFVVAAHCNTVVSVIRFLVSGYCADDARLGVPEMSMFCRNLSVPVFLIRRIMGYPSSVVDIHLFVPRYS